MGLTDKGYVRSTYDEILAGKIRRAKELFGDDIDTGDQSLLGKYLRINAYDQALTEEEIEAVYYARFPNSASGTSLDRLLAFGGISRNPAEQARYSVKFTGTAGYVIPVGFLVGTDTELTYYTTEDNTIGDDGTRTAVVCCTESGTIGNVNASAINKITNPDASVTAVVGTECLSPGKDEENDADLRVRLQAAITGAGSCNEDALRAAILRVPTVQYVAVVSNDTNETDSEGRPAHSFQCYVKGGDNYAQEIAEAIFAKRPIGIQSVGDKSVTITDASGNSKVVKYSETQTVSITILAKIKTSTAFPADGVAQIQANVAAYINGLGVGGSLVLSTLYGYIYNVMGVTEVTELKASINGGSTYSTSGVTVPRYGVAVCSQVNVEVVT